MSAGFSCGKCGRQIARQSNSGEKVNFCSSCGAAAEQPQMVGAQGRDRGSPAPSAIPPAVVGQVGSKPRVAPSPEPFVQQPKAATSAMWVIVPAVAAAMTVFGFLMCGGVFVLFLAIGGSSEASYEPEPYTVYSVPTAADPYSSTPADAYGSVPGDMSGMAAYDPASYSDPVPTDYASTPSSESPYVPASYATEPYASAPVEIAPTYAEPIPVEPAYVEPSYVDPASGDPLASPAGETQFWSFTDPESDLLAAIQRDEEELVTMDAAILAARAGEIAGGVEAQDGETALDQLFGIAFAVGSDAVEQGLLADRATVQARLDANRAELARLRGY